MSSAELCVKSDIISLINLTPWYPYYRCHHCASLLEVLEDLSSTLEPEGVQFARVNIDESTNLKNRCVYVECVVFTDFSC